MNVVVRRNVFGTYYAEALAAFADSSSENLWTKGCHKAGYDYLDINHRRDFSTVYGLAKDILQSKELTSFRLLRMSEGCVVLPHFDPLKDNTEVRSLNMMLAPPELGGVLKINSVEVNLGPGDAAVYSASLEVHEITKVERGTLFMFSAQVTTHGL